MDPSLERDRSGKGRLAPGTRLRRITVGCLLAGSVIGPGLLDLVSPGLAPAYAAELVRSDAGSSGPVVSQQPTASPGPVHPTTPGPADGPAPVWRVMTWSGAFLALTGVLLLLVRAVRHVRAGREPATGPTRRIRAHRTGAEPPRPGSSEPGSAQPRATQPRPTQPEAVRCEPAAAPARRSRRTAEPVATPELAYRISLLGGDRPDPVFEAGQAEPGNDVVAAAPDRAVDGGAGLGTTAARSAPRTPDGLDPTTELAMPIPWGERPAPALSAPPAAMMTELVVAVDDERVTVRLDGSRTSAGAYAGGRADHLDVPLWIGESGSGPMYIDAGQCPDVMTVTGAPDARRRVIRALLRRLEAGLTPPLVTVVGRAGETDAFTRQQRFDRLDQLRGAPDPTVPQLLVCLDPRHEDGPLLRQLIEASRGAVVPIVVGEVPTARWSLHVEPSSLQSSVPAASPAASPAGAGQERVASVSPIVAPTTSPASASARDSSAPDSSAPDSSGRPPGLSGPPLRKKRTMWVPPDPTPDA